MRECRGDYVSRWSAKHTLFTACLLSGLLSTSCASPVLNVWPPGRDDSSRTVFVSIDSWHAVIALPNRLTDGQDRPAKAGTLAADADSDPMGAMADVFEEWGYAERGWYLDGRTGLTGVLRALLWPTAAVVEVGRYNRLWADRTPQPPADLFRFSVTQEGYRRLRRYLRATIADGEPVVALGQSTFYPAVRSYHLFHTCHQYAAAALREAGLPVWAFGAVTRTFLAMQLRRAARMDTNQEVHAVSEKFTSLAIATVK